MAIEWGSLLSGIGNIISGVGSTVTGIKLGEVQKKYQKKFYLLAAQKQAAEQEAQKELTEIQKEALIKEAEAEERRNERLASIFQDWLFARGVSESQEKLSAGGKDISILDGQTVLPFLLGLGLLLLFRRKKKHR